MSVAMIGFDTAKASFQVHGVDEEGRAEIKRKLPRGGVVAFFEAQPACTVVLEACGAAHHWGRVLAGLGHTVKLIAPEAVRPFVKPGRKNDAADAAALCEAARRPGVKFVPVKGLEQQACWRCTRPARCWSSSGPCWPTRCAASPRSSAWSCRRASPGWAS